MNQLKVRAVVVRGVYLPFSFRNTPHLATTMGTYPYTELSPRSSMKDMATFAYLILDCRETPKIPVGVSTSFPTYVSVSNS